MSRSMASWFRTILFGVGVLIGSGHCRAAGAGDFMTLAETTPTAKAEASSDPSWYHEQSTKPSPEAIIQQKAQMRAQQRMDRIASMQWYGMSGGRPQSIATPFSSRYGSLWEMPGGKPYSWYPYVRPGYVMYWR
jgi:hypothetical protein